VSDIIFSTLFELTLKTTESLADSTYFSMASLFNYGYDLVVIEIFLLFFSAFSLNFENTWCLSLAGSLIPGCLGGLSTTLPARPASSSF